MNERVSSDIGALHSNYSSSSLAVHEGLDIETQCGTNSHNILTVELLEDRSLSSIIEAAKVT